MRQPKKKVQVPSDRRKRALFSCDRCKSKKRACKRFLQGQQIFDDSTPCDNCVNSNSSCIVTIPRKERKYFSVSKTTLKQLRYLIGIVKAMFPECDPENLDHLKKVAEALFVQIPVHGSDDDDDDDDDDDEHDDENDDEGNGGVAGVSEESDHAKSQPSTDSLPSSSIKVEDKLILKAREVTRLHTLGSNTDRMKMQRANSLPTSINDNGASKPKPTQGGAYQIALGGSDRLFNALLKISSDQTTIPEAASNVLLNKPTHTPTSMPLRVNGVDIHRSLILNLLPPHECELYVTIFFDRIHKSYILYSDEKRFKARHSYFLTLITGQNTNFEEFCNEEICEIYLVWILGRNCLLELKGEDPNFFPYDIVPDSIIDQYFEVVIICFSGCLLSSNIHCIRSFYLMGLHCSAILKKGTAWQLFANCCLKMSSMGLNKEASLSKYSEEYKEEVRVVWWSGFKLHMNNCAIMGKLPNITNYEVDLSFPKLESMEDSLLKETYLRSLELFQIMFKVLKNRDDLHKNRNPWCDENLKRIGMISDCLKAWVKNTSEAVKDYKKPNTPRYLIKLHFQYNFCCTCLIVPYLIAIVINPLRPRNFSHGMVETLCYGMKSAVELVQIVKSSVKSGFFNGMLHYDMFYAYNSLMNLLLAYKIFKGNYEQFNLIKRELVNIHKIDLTVIVSSIMEIKNVNEIYGVKAAGNMRGFSDNINILLQYFGFATPVKEEFSIDNPIYNNTIPSPFPTNVDVSNSETADPMEKGFFDFINHINTTVDGADAGFNDQLLLDWNKMFGFDDGM